MIRLSTALFIQKARSACTTGTGTERDLAAWCRPRGECELETHTELLPPSWDVALVHHCGFWSHYDAQRAQSSFPLLPGMTIAEMAWYAEWRGVLDEYPVAGDIFFQYSLRRRRYVHVGIVEEVQRMGRFNPRAPYCDLTTIEGDTNQYGELRGGRTMRLARRLSHSEGDRFFRWAALEAARGVPDVARVRAGDVRRAA